MKKFLFLVLMALVSVNAFAAIEIQEDGTTEGIVARINYSTGQNVSISGNTATVTADPVDITSAVFEGSTADAYETTLAVVDPTADNTFTLPDASGYAMYSTLATNKADAASSVWGVSGGLTLEGSTADASETTITATDPTADRTVTVPDQTGTVMLSASASAITAGTTPTITVAPGNRLFTDTITTDNQDQTIGVSGTGSAGDRMTIIFVTDAAGSNDEVITFGTNIRSTGTLTLANAASSRYVVSFVSDGTKWNEVSRTGVQAA